MKYAIIHVADSRDDYYVQREPMVRQELEKLEWLRGYGEALESSVLRDTADVGRFVQSAEARGAQALVIHIPIWADPCLAARASDCALPLLLLGNRRGDTSSMVGMLGAGGALDQLGRKHFRVYLEGGAGQAEVLAFLQSAGALAQLRGRKLLRFGGCSLGILTAEPDLELWRDKFGLCVEQLDQEEIIRRALALPEETVKPHLDWVSSHADVQLGSGFPAAAFDRQLRSYMALRALVDEHGADFIAVKCQRELSDGFVCQCIPHMLFGGTEDARGKKRPTIFACESDANGALTMEVLHLLSGGKPAALLDVRQLDTHTGRLLIANCGAVPEDMMRTDEAVPLSGVSLIPHTFGAGRGGACRGVLRQGVVTLARLCMKDRACWMAAACGEVTELTAAERESVPPSFPCGAIKTGLDERFLQEFGSNHLHLVYGDYLAQLRCFCELAGIDLRIWQCGKEGRS